MKIKILLPLITVACLLAVPARAQVNYVVSGGTAYVASSPNASGNIVIASTYNGYPVTTIGSSAFYGRTSLTGVTIPNSVTNIAESAFYGCKSLTSVTIPHSITTIGGGAFTDCTSLTSVTIPDSVTGLGIPAFSGCTSLTNFSVAAANLAYSSLDGVLFNKAQTTLITFPAGRGGSYVIPESVTTIVTRAFYGCASLTSVMIRDSVTSIGVFAFDGCVSLTNLTVDDANSWFSSLDGVLFDKAQTTLIAFPAGHGASYVIPDSVTAIGDGAFTDCASLMSVTIPNSVTSIGWAAFSGCASLTSVTIPDSVTGLGMSAFSGCTSLTNVTIPSSVSSIGDGTFSECASLMSVTIPNTVTSIGAAAFWICTSLTSVTIPNTVTSIGGSAFFRCTSLTNVTIPDSVTRIEDSAFTDCTSLTSVTIGNSVSSIGIRAFLGCTNLTSVTFGNSVTSIGDQVFFGCTSLTNFSVPVANPACSSLDGVLFNKAQTTLITFPAGRGGIYVIPDSVTNLGSYAFASCASLTSVTIGNSVRSIGIRAFLGCTNLTTVTIPNSVTSLGIGAFFNCTSLTSVTIGNSVTNIGGSAFARCTSLTNLTFLGNRPGTAVSMFDNVGAGATVYYYYGTTGWGPTYGGLPTMMLGAPAPQIGTASAGVKPGGFGFALTGVVNQTIVVEASTNLVNWQPLGTNTLSDASAEFVDPEWFNQPHRFYRARSF